MIKMTAPMTPGATLFDMDHAQQARRECTGWNIHYREAQLPLFAYTVYADGHFAIVVVPCLERGE